MICPIIDKCAIKLQVGILTPNLPIFHTFSVNSQNTFPSADFVWYICLVLIQTCSRTIVELT